MSTKTNFKRIALVAVAALGLGVLSSVPSQAATSNVTVSVVNGTATTTVSDSTTAAIVNVNGYVTAVGDTIVVGLVNKTAPAASGSFVGRLYVFETTTLASRLGIGSAVVVPAITLVGGTNAARLTAANDSVTAGTSAGFALMSDNQATASYLGAKFGVYIESGSVMPVAGTYTFTVLTSVYSAGSLNAIQPAAVDVSITVATPASASLVATAASTAVMGSGTFTSGTIDSTVAVSSTASSTTAATVRVTLINAAGNNNARESITVTIDKGLVGTSAGVYGRSLTLAVASATTDILVRPDGSSGVAALKISTPSVTFPTKSITFYGAATAIKGGVISSVVGNTSTLGVWGTATDATSANLGAGTALYAYSSDTTVISNFGTACVWNATTSYAECSLTGVKDGTATITLRDAATVAASTVSASAGSVRSAVNKVATSYKVTTSAASFAPGAPGTILVTVYDADGKVMPAGTYTNLFTTGGITATLPMGTAINGTLSSASVTTAANPVASATLPVVSLDPVMQYYYYMPVTGGTLGLVHKGGASLPVAAQVTTTTTATITDNAAAALAAVTALATTVASLKTLITTLTNLVLKIQKKVKA